MWLILRKVMRDMQRSGLVDAHWRTGAVRPTRPLDDSVQGGMRDLLMVATGALLLPGVPMIVCGGRLGGLLGQALIFLGGAIAGFPTVAIVALHTMPTRRGSGRGNRVLSTAFGRERLAMLSLLSYAVAGAAIVISFDLGAFR